MNFSCPSTVRSCRCRHGSRGFLLAGLIGLTSFNLAGLRAAPTVNGLFYGDDDQSRYVLYNTSIGGSKLWYTVSGNRLYVALVVDRSVNDNVFSSKSNRAYTTDAGWGPHRAAKRLTDSEFAQFTLTIGKTKFEWSQGYAERVGGVWKSDHTTGAGSGTPPPGYASSSSFAWNINTYEANPAPAWNLYAGGSAMDDWQSPFDPANPAKVVGLEGYPATGLIGFSPTYQYEWPMVYEWSVDLSSFGPDPIFVISGKSHHSPNKNDNGEDDPFPTPPGNGYISDYGDLPAPYPTLLSDNGPCHYLVPNGARLGALADPEPDGLPGEWAGGDDGSGSDDEDGVTLVGQLVPGSEAVLRVTAGTAGHLSAFVDWTGDGTLEPLVVVSATGPDTIPAGALGDQPLAAGVYDLTVAVPANAATRVYTRFRFTNNAHEGGNSPTGVAVTGEVEDHVWQVYRPLSSGIDLRAYQGADGVYAEFIAYDVEQAGSIRLGVFDERGEMIWNGTVEVQPGPKRVCRFRIPGLAVGETYDFKVRDEVGKLWTTPNVTVKPFAMKMVRMAFAGMNFSFNSLPDRDYEIQWTARLGAPWQTVTNVTAFGEQTHLAVPLPDPAAPAGFFRVIQK